MLVHTGWLVFSFLSPPGPCKSAWLMTERSLSSNISVGLGRGQAVNKPLRGWFYILLFYHKNLNFPFCGKQNPLSLPHQQDCGLWITSCPQEILKINRLLDGITGTTPAPCPLESKESPLPSSVTSVPTSCVDEEIDQSVNDLRIHRCVAEKPWGHTLQISWVGASLLPPQFKASMELGEGVSEDGTTNPRSLQMGSRAETENQRTSWGLLQWAFQNTGWGHF